MEIIDLNEEQSELLENMLDEYDFSFIKFRLDGSVEIGICDNDQLIAGLVGCNDSLQDYVCFHRLCERGIPAQRVWSIVNA